MSTSFSINARAFARSFQPPAAEDADDTAVSQADKLRRGGGTPVAHARVGNVVVFIAATTPAPRRAVTNDIRSGGCVKTPDTSVVVQVAQRPKLRENSAALAPRRQRVQTPASAVADEQEG